MHRVAHFLMVYIFPIQLVIGVAGNVLNLIVLLNRRMRSTTNILLASVAIADIFFLLLMLPITVRYNFVLRSVKLLAEFVLHANNHIAALANLCAFSSTWFLVAVCFRRLIAVRWPLKARTWRINRVSALTIVLCVSVVGFFVTMHSHITHTVTKVPVAAPLTSTRLPGSDHRNDSGILIRSVPGKRLAVPPLSHPPETDRNMNDVRYAIRTELRPQLRTYWRVATMVNTVLQVLVPVALVIFCNVLMADTLFHFSDGLTKVLWSMCRRRGNWTTGTHPIVRRLRPVASENGVHTTSADCRRFLLPNSMPCSPYGVRKPELQQQRQQLFWRRWHITSLTNHASSTPTDPDDVPTPSSARIGYEYRGGSAAPPPTAVVNGSCSFSAPNNSHYSQNQRHATIVVLAIATAFAVCHLPSALVYIWELAEPSAAGHDPFLTAATVANSLVVTGKMTNFFLFCMSSRTFRRHLRRLVFSGGSTTAKKSSQCSYGSGATILSGTRYVPLLASLLPRGLLNRPSASYFAGDASPWRFAARATPQHQRPRRCLTTESLPLAEAEADENASQPKTPSCESTRYCM